MVRATHEPGDGLAKARHLQGSKAWGRPGAKGAFRERKTTLSSKHGACLCACLILSANVLK